MLAQPDTPGFGRLVIIHIFYFWMQPVHFQYVTIRAPEGHDLHRHRPKTQDTALLRFVISVAVDQKLPKAEGCSIRSGMWRQYSNVLH